MIVDPLDQAGGCCQQARGGELLGGAAPLEEGQDLVAARQSLDVRQVLDEHPGRCGGRCGPSGGVGVGRICPGWRGRVRGGPRGLGGSRRVGEARVVGVGSSVGRLS